MPGRRPKPNALKEAQGNPGRRPINVNEPKPTESGLPLMPTHLDGAAAAEWKRVCAILPDGWVTKTDRATLTAYCTAWGRYVEASDALRHESAVIKTKSGYPVQSPWIAIERAALSDLLRHSIELGFTPAARSKINLPDAEPDDEDEFSGV